MAGRALNLKDLIVEDQLGCRIARYWQEWNTARQDKLTLWDELRRYVYATDTTQTTNSKLPWKNKTTIPKLCQIRDNLFANYMASMFPKRKWMMWEANDEASQMAKKEAIINYASWITEQESYEKEIAKLVLDYIDYGNIFVMADWEDQTIELEDKTQVGYVGPVLKRVCPIDIVFNPIADSFDKAPKVIRSFVTLGDVKELLTRYSAGDDIEYAEDLFKYFKDIRSTAQQYGGEIKVKDSWYQMDGFTSWRTYLEGDYVELLTFYGDIYDYEKDEYLRNHVVVVADRHKVLYKKPNPSYFGKPPIWHCGWRPRQDNLWAMGPLDNLVGMQYRIDHIENLKADVFDLVTFPPLKIKGYVEDFTWQPMEKITVGDDGDVTMLTPPAEVLNANIEIQNLENKMEEMAGAPKEAMGFRTPGEKTMYEVQRLENAAARVFQEKIKQFERQVIEPTLNAMLEIARRKMTSTSIRVFDDELKFTTFMTLGPNDITGNGRIRPIAARHFAERAELVQNITNFANSPLGQDPDIMVHFSGLKMARMFEEVLDLEDYKIVMPYIRLSEKADAQRLANSHMEQVQMETQTPHGLTPDDYDEDMMMEQQLNIQDGDEQQQTTPAAGVDQAPPSGPPGLL